MVRLSRKEMQAQTRNKLLEAAVVEIARKGVEATTIRDIAASAGYSLGAFYSNFETKEAMLREMMERHMRDELQEFKNMAHATNEDNLTNVISNISQWIVSLNNNKNIALIDLALQTYANSNSDFKQEFDQFKKLRHVELAAGLKEIFDLQGLRPPLDPLQMAVGFASLWCGFPIHGDVAWAEPAETIIMAFFKALLDSAEPLDKPGSETEDRRSL